MAERRAGRDAPRVAFYVQHLLGIGHLVRAFRIADALAAAGCEVEVLAGGVLPAGLAVGRARVVQLPPVKAGQDGMVSLAHPDGTPFDAEAQAARRDRLLAHVAAFSPDVLLIEAFPFGRRQMRFELIPLLEACSSWASPPLIATSIRDILQEARRPERAAETVDLIECFFELVLVHGDPALTRLEATFPRAGAFVDKIAYTGLVAPASSAETSASGDPFDVVVSAGGGAVGDALLRTALQARPLTRFADRRWLFLTGPNLPPAMAADLAAASDERTAVKTFVPGLVRLLQAASLSISQAGYNTVADLLVARCPAVLVPFAAGGETEQTTRATLLAAQGCATVVAEGDLAPPRLAAAIDAAASRPPAATRFALDGAQRTAQILKEALARRQRARNAR